MVFPSSNGFIIPMLTLLLQLLHKLLLLPRLIHPRNRRLCRLYIGHALARLQRVLLLLQPHLPHPLLPSLSAYPDQVGHKGALVLALFELVVVLGLIVPPLELVQGLGQLVQVVASVPSRRHKVLAPDLVLAA